MHIGIDCSCVAKPERTGVARYCAALLRELPAVLGPEDRVTMLYRFSRLRRRRWFERVDDPRFQVALFQDGLPFGPGGLDVVHGPDVRIPRIRRTPAVATVHDLSALVLPGIARESFRRKKFRALEDVANRSRLVMCISEFTRQAFIEHFPHAERRTRVVPLGLSPRFRPSDQATVSEVLGRLGVGRRYLLFVGQISARKNLLPLLDAFLHLRADPRFADVELVLAGPVQTGGEEVVDRARTSAAAGAIRFPGFVSDEDLPALYSGAQCFCFVGKGEGFGLPILEAMACGCPVVVSRAGANVSTAGGAALITDPDDPADIRSALEGLLLDPGARESARSRGFERSEEFSWRRTAIRTVECYREALAVGVSA